MFKLAPILLLSSVALLHPPAMLAAPAAAAAEQPPALRLDDRARPLRMAVDLTLVPAREGFTGTARIALELLRPTRTLWLNASRLAVEEAWLEDGANRRALAVLPGNDDFVGLDLGRELPPGPATVGLRYSGRYEMTETAGIFKQTEAGQPYLFTQFESTDARRAFPCFDEPAFKIPWQVTLRVPRGQVAVSNSPALDAEAAGAGGAVDGTDELQTLVFAETPPMPSYLVAFAVGPFELVDAGKWGSKKTPLRIVAFKDRAADAAWAAEVTGPILEQLERYFGTPYPYAKLDSVAIPQTVGFGAMENAGLITYVDRLILIKPADSNENTRRAYADVAAHELAHMWFGDLVTMTWWDDIWLNEGFASWMGDGVVETWKPEWGGGVDKVHRRSAVMESDFLATARQVRQPIASKDDIENAFDGITYRKGASLLSWFEQWMSPAVFQRGVRRYLERHAWGNATSHDFLAALSEAGGTTIGPAFASFLDQPGVPLVSVDVRCQPGSTPRLVLAQRRFLPLGSTAAPQRWRVPMRIRYVAGGQPGELKVLLTGDRADIALSGAAACPDFLLANDGELGYYVAAYPSERFRALLADAAHQLSTAEQLGLLRDAYALTASGDLPFAEALAAAARAAGSPDRQVVETALDITLAVRDHLVPAAQRADYARFVRLTFGPRAAALGFQPRAGEPADDQLLRPRVLIAAADEGEDPELRRAAGVLARRWLQDRTALSAEMAGPVLAIAALDGDAAFFDALLAEARRVSDRRDKRRLMNALGSFRDPVLARRALALTLDSGIDIRDSAEVLFTVIELEAGRQLAHDFVKENFDALVGRLPETYSGRLPRIAKGFCDAAHRDDLERFYAERSKRLLGGPRILAQTLESITLCNALQAAQRASVAEFLADAAHEPTIDQQRQEPIGVSRR